MTVIQKKNTKNDLISIERQSISTDIRKHKQYNQQMQKIAETGHCRHTVTVNPQLKIRTLSSWATHSANSTIIQDYSALVANKTTQNKKT